MIYKSKGKKKDLVAEFASRADYANNWAMMQYLPNPDPILKKLGKDISAYKEILSDAHVGGCVRRRKAAIKSLESRLTESDNGKFNDVLTATFERLPVKQLISQILNAPLFGYQPLEIMWHEENGLILPKSVIAKPADWFLFDNDNQLRFKSKKHNDGELLPSYKFLLATHEADYENPYGRADLSLCFWAALFKKGGFKYWLTFIEKYGAPFLVGKHPRQASDAETDLLLESLESMIASSVAAIPSDSSIEIVESAGKGASSEAYDTFLHFCRSEISIALLGQNQTTEAEANRASATAGMAVTEDIRDDDASIVESCFNQLIDWIDELNFGSTDKPRFELFEQQSVDKVQAERDQILTLSGAHFTNAYFERTYDLEPEDLHPQVVPTGGKPADFSEADLSEEPELILEKAVSTLPNLLHPWREQIFNLFKTEGAVEALDKLAELMPELDSQALTEQLTRVIFVSEMYGRLTAKAEQDVD